MPSDDELAEALAIQFVQHILSCTPTVGTCNGVLTLEFGEAGEAPDAFDLLDRALDALRARPEARAGDGTGERVRHLKRGTEYEVLGEAEMQVSTVPPEEALVFGDEDGHPAIRLIGDSDKLTVYRCLKTGKLWSRFTDEFRDGRFETAPTAQPNTEGRDA